MKAFIEKIELYPEKREDGCWILRRFIIRLREVKWGK